MNPRHNDPRLRRQAHRLAAVAGGLPVEQAAAEADPAEAPTPLEGAVRLEVATEDWRARIRAEVSELEPEVEQLLEDGLAVTEGYLREHFPHPVPAAQLEDDHTTPQEDLRPEPPAGGPLERELTANRPVRACTCHPHGACLDSCLACLGLPEDVPCPAHVVAVATLQQEQDGPAAGAAVPEPGPAPAARASSVPTHAGRALAWAANPDPRSLDYLVRARLAHRVPIQDRSWAHGPILDQGTVPPLSLHDGSSCTGNMAVNLRNVLELATVSPYTRPQDVDFLDEDDARRIYDEAQELDDWPGDAYPGTSVLAAMKAGQAAGWWTDYLWCTGTADIAQALLQVGPVGIGVPFLEGMASPGPDGIVTATGRELGGHAMAVHALRRTVAGRPGPWFGALQSYGPSVGDSGVVWIHHQDLAKLLAGQGEAAVPIVPGLLS